MKLPFGGLRVDEQEIDLRSDPSNLLAEVAQCAYDGVPLRPALARWYWAMWKADRISVLRARGASPKESDSRQATAIRKINLLIDQGLGKDEAIRHVRLEMALQVDHNTIYTWLRDVDSAEASVRASLERELEAAAVAKFQALSNDGVEDETALEIVRAWLDGRPRPSDDTLKAWQWQAHHAPPPEPNE